MAGAGAEEGRGPGLRAGGRCGAGCGHGTRPARWSAACGGVRRGGGGTQAPRLTASAVMKGLSPPTNTNRARASRSVVGNGTPACTAWVPCGQGGGRGRGSGGEGSALRLAREGVERGRAGLGTAAGCQAPCCTAGAAAAAAADAHEGAAACLCL